jgi:hypothetical protein
MTIGFIDTASINSATGALSVGDPNNWGAWDKQCLFDVTYLFLHNNMRAVPTLDNRRSPTGYTEHVISKFPQLKYFDPQKQGSALNQTKKWVIRNKARLVLAWKQANEDSDFTAWADVHRQQMFIDHVRRHGSLVESAFIPILANILGVTEKELKDADNLSRNLSVVERWAKSSHITDEFKLVYEAWLLSGIIRGKYHMHLAAKEGIHLLQHPYRKYIKTRLKAAQPELVTNTEAYFINFIISSALLERKPDNRVKAWLDNINTARAAIESPSLNLREGDTESEAEDLAFGAAKRINLPCHSARLRKLVTLTVSSGLSAIIGFKISPWVSPLGFAVKPAIEEAYKKIRKGREIPEDIRNLIFTKGRFQKLQSRIPGRIERQPPVIFK